MKDKRFRDLIGVAIGFILLFTVLVVERIGIMYEEKEPDIQILPDDQIVHMKESSREKTCLLLWNSEDTTSQNAYKIYNQVLIDMRVPFKVMDVNEEGDYEEALSGCKTMVIAISDFDCIGRNILTITGWVGKGGRLLLGIPPFKTDIFDFVSSKLGIISSNYAYSRVDDFVSEPDYMLGAQITYPIVDGYESSTSVVLDDKCKVYAHTEDGKVPLVWSRDYQKGKFVVCNFGYSEKAYRGIYASAYTLLEDYFIYPVINASTFYLDDFPSPVPDGNGEYVKRDYNMGIAEFYSRVWWPDMLTLGRKHDIKYTGLIIETYRDQTYGDLPANDSTANYYYYGNMLLNQGGELGYHGYNHQPLCLENYVYHKELGYKIWENYDTMKASFDELVRFSGSIFPTQKMTVYVPPSDILSEEGRRLLGIGYPQVKVIASIYLEGEDEYVQEFSVSSDGMIETPRVISGGVLDDYMKITALSELNFHFVCSHFMHPDDLLDEDRGAELGWEVQKNRLDAYMGWVDESGKNIRHLTGSEMGGAVQRYVNLIPSYYSVKNENIVLNTTGLIDTAFYLIRVNEGEIAEAYGGELTKLNDTLYLLKVKSHRVTITRR
ncbi:DUF2194 domain-containing protein [Butyrivibrio sp. YAB3001]|uniref:DUF2194 domain-containing protein n=1 Tax=Butyrivibrio sp. YAB3001 TaxID=1520812 RepID=UPI0008F63B73|nr:DUF2194 domain-containing protein [Butyrivibrio sp. YAB3001]SFC09983.1 hypothetical protein SAMN02910398_01486 [Butyrivibrio sp. YAB3001]